VTDSEGGFFSMLLNGAEKGPVDLSYRGAGANNLTHLRSTYCQQQRVSELTLIVSPLLVFTGGYDRKD